MRFFVSDSGAAALAAAKFSFGSGDPTRIICSALIARRSTRSAIRSCPRSPGPLGRPGARFCTSAFSLYMPRDFDISPYFEVVSDHRARLRLHRPALGRQAEAAPGGSQRSRHISRTDGIRHQLVPEEIDQENAATGFQCGSSTGCRRCGAGRARQGVGALHGGQISVTECRVRPRQPTLELVALRLTQSAADECTLSARLVMPGPRPRHHLMTIVPIIPASR